MIMIKLMSCHLPSVWVWKKLKNYALIFSGKMHHLCRKRTELCRQISAVDKGDIKPFECTKTVKRYPQFKLPNRMHNIFANFDNCVISLANFSTSISSFTQFFYSVLNYACRICICGTRSWNVSSLVTRHFLRNKFPGIP